MPAKIYVIPTDTCIGFGCRLDDKDAYEMLIKIKGRNKEKPIAIMVPTWDDLIYESTLTPTQINFLKTYKFPFTIISQIRQDFRDEYPILDEYDYKTVGFRVAQTCLPPETLPYIQSPLFLTSANKSGQGECFTRDEVNEIFADDLDVLKFLPGKSGHQPSSNVIQFVWTTNDLKYMRKNYPRT